MRLTLVLVFYIGPKGPLYNMLSVDYSTSVEIINKNFKTLTMDNVDLASDMKVNRNLVIPRCIWMIKFNFCSNLGTRS